MRGRPINRTLRGNLEPDMRAEKGSWSVYLLCWRRHGGLQYIGMSQDVDRRINAHRKAGRLPFAQLGDPVVEVLYFGLNVYAACDAERREIMARLAMTPHGYNESSGGEYAGSRSDTLFSSDHLHRLSRAAVGVERMDRSTHEEEAGDSCRVRRRSCDGAVLGGVLGRGRALAQWRLCGADRTARGSWTRLHLRDAAGCGGEPQITLVTPDGAPSHGLKADAPAFWLGPLVVMFEPWSPKALQ